MSDRWVLASDPREGEEPDWHERLEELNDLRGITQSAHRCEHGIDLERATCAPCDPLLRALGIMLDKIEGGDR